MRWAYWWNSTESIPELVTDGEVLLELNTDFGVSGMRSGELAAVVSAWKDGAISQDTMLELFRKREMLQDGRSNKDEMALIADGKVAAEAGAGMGQEDVTPPLKVVRLDVNGSEHNLNRAPLRKCPGGGDVSAPGERRRWTAREPGTRDETAPRGPMALNCTSIVPLLFLYCFSIAGPRWLRRFGGHR